MRSRDKSGEAGRKLLTATTIPRLAALRAALAGLEDWRVAPLEAAARQIAETDAVKLGDVAQPLRAALTGSNVSPPIFEVMQVLGRDETLGRIADALG